MLRLLAAAWAAVLCLSAAHAADLGRPPPAAVVEAPDESRWNRSGLYAGAVAGYNTQVLEVEGVNLGNGELMGGAFAGYNYRLSPMWMLGVELDLMLTKIKGSTDVGGVTVTASHEHLMSLRGRFGPTFGPAYLYATAGAAWQQTNLSAGSFSDTEWEMGGVVGAGIEMELTRSLFARVEVLHYIFSDNKSVEEVESSQTVGRVGVGFKF